MFYYIFYAPISGRRMELKTPFVGAMKIARQPRILASTPMNGTHPFPAPSLREQSRPTGVTEGVYPVEW